MRRQKVIDHPDLERDPSSGLIVNVDRTSLQAAKAKKHRQLQMMQEVSSQKRQMQETSSRISSLEDRLSNIEQLLEKTLSAIINNNNNGKGN